MEILRKSALILFFASFILCPAGKLAAQDYKVLQEAFSSSYSLETAGKYTAAIEAIRKHYDESSYEINVRLGWLNYLAGQFAESVTFYNRAIQLMPYSIEARLGFVYPASSMGNWDQVISKYLEILKIDPANYTANYRLGLIYYTRKEYNPAFKYFEKLVNMFPINTSQPSKESALIISLAVPCIR